MVKKIERRHEDPELQKAYEIYEDIYSRYNRKEQFHRKGANHYDYEALATAWNYYLKLRKQIEGK